MKPFKVFGIGFHKTGTTSLASALDILGYTVTGPDGAHNPDIADEVHDMAFSLAEKFDAFQDNPWPLLYKELDARYPGSKFILTLRPTEKWIDSLVKHFGTKTTPMREWIYGNTFGFPEGNEDIYIKRYEEHNSEVEAYFRGRSADLLIFRLTEGDGWNKLCGFLGETVPDCAFPHENSQSARATYSWQEKNIFAEIKLKLFRKQH